MPHVRGGHSFSSIIQQVFDRHGLDTTKAEPETKKRDVPEHLNSIEKNLADYERLYIKRRKLNS